MKTALFLGVLFWVSGASTRIQTLKKVYTFLSDIWISESTPPTVTKRASQFRRPLLGYSGSWTAAEAGRSGGSPAAPARGARRQVRQLSSRSTIPFSFMSRFMDFRESRPKFLSPNSSQPWPIYPPLRVFTCCGSTRDVRRSLYDS